MCCVQRVELGRSLLDVTQDKVLDGVKSDGSHPQRSLHRGMKVLHLEGFQQAQDLNIFASARLDHARFHQPPQGLELRRQVPLHQWGSLIQSIDLPLNQGKEMDGIKDHVLTIIAAWVAGNGLRLAADYHLIDIGADPDILCVSALL
jgi:hypothetical protein